MTDEPSVKADPARLAREAAWKVRCAADIARALVMRQASDQHSPEDIADRASEISDKLWRQAAHRGWTY